MIFYDTWPEIHLVSACLQICLWAIAQHGTLIATLIGHTLPLTTVAFAPDGTLLASGSRDQTVQTVSPGAPLLVLYPLALRMLMSAWPVTMLMSLWFAMLAGYTATIGAISNATSTIAMMQVHHQQHQSKNHSSSDALEPRQHVRLIHCPTQVRLWNVSTYKAVAVLRGHNATVEQVAWRPTGALLASCGDDGTVRTWGLDWSAVQVSSRA